MHCPCLALQIILRAGLALNVRKAATGIDSSGQSTVHACAAAAAAAGVKPVEIELTDFKTKKVVDTLEVDACMVATGRAPYTNGEAARAGCADLLPLFCLLSLTTCGFVVPWPRQLSLTSLHDQPALSSFVDNTELMCCFSPFPAVPGQA
jgi:hypothetical protein